MKNTGKKTAIAMLLTLSPLCLANPIVAPATVTIDKLPGETFSAFQGAITAFNDKYQTLYDNCFLAAQLKQGTSVCINYQIVDTTPLNGHIVNELPRAQWGVTEISNYTRRGIDGYELYSTQRSSQFTIMRSRFSCPEGMYLVQDRTTAYCYED
ncbi:hypothetical protein KO528_00020 [Saccharophagus degradans]|uniref:hypothetical protein n=1 Tax=Saccharophagus degradans TaxID=86304 RepID=UPI001C09EEE1|nr:hypothetical protein [Saccharophagus degradans]MBU2983720.1 hypothetical protein [Saccharophagus degradans]